MRFSSGPLIACLPLALLVGCDRQPSQPAQPAAVPTTAGSEGTAKFDMTHKGAAVPTDAFQDPAGKRVTLAAFKGQPLLVNLWATWCAPCVKEMPALDRLAARTKGKLHVLTVNQDSAKQAVDPVPGWWAVHKLTQLELYRDPQNDLGFAFGGGLPTTVLYDAQGREVWRLNGGMDWDGAEAKAALARVPN